MILLWSSRNGGLRYIRIKRRSELSGYELTGVDCNTSRVRTSESDRLRGQVGAVGEEQEETALYQGVLVQGAGKLGQQGSETPHKCTQCPRTQEDGDEAAQTVQGIQSREGPRTVHLVVH